MPSFCETLISCGTIRYRMGYDPPHKVEERSPIISYTFLFPWGILPLQRDRSLSCDHGPDYASYINARTTTPTTTLELETKYLYSAFGVSTGLVMQW